MDKTLCNKEEGKKAFKPCKEKIFEDSHSAHSKNCKMELEPLNPMLFYPAFPHVAEKIFDQLDQENLKTCRKVEKLWQKCIDNRYLLWNKLVKKEDGKKVFKEALRANYLSANHHPKIAEMLIQRSVEFGIDLNVKG